MFRGHSAYLLGRSLGSAVTGRSASGEITPGESNPIRAERCTTRPAWSGDPSIARGRDRGRRDRRRSRRSIGGPTTCGAPGLRLGPSLCLARVWQPLFVSCTVNSSSAILFSYWRSRFSLRSLAASPLAGWKSFRRVQPVLWLHCISHLRSSTFVRCEKGDRGQERKVSHRQSMSGTVTYF